MPNVAQCHTFSDRFSSTDVFAQDLLLNLIIEIICIDQSRVSSFLNDKISSFRSVEISRAFDVKKFADLFNCVVPFLRLLQILWYLNRQSLGNAFFHDTAVNGNQKCSDFGNSECSIFGIKTTVLLASAVQ